MPSRLHRLPTAEVKSSLHVKPDGAGGLLCWTARLPHSFACAFTMGRLYALKGLLGSIAHCRPLFHVRRNGNRNLSCGRPFRAAHQGQAEAGAIHGLHIMAQRRLEHSSHAVGESPDHRLIFSCAAIFAARSAVARIVIGRRQKVDIRLH